MRSSSRKFLKVVGVVTGASAVRWRCALAVLYLALLSPSAALASVQALFNPDVVEQAPFPSDRFTVPNSANITGLQVNLPLPDCTVRPTDCNILRVINTLDGFNLDPRLSIPFSGPIDVNSVNSDTMFVVKLGKSLKDHGRKNHGPKDRIVGINQVVWDPATNTLHAESDQLLEQDTAYAVVVTDGVHDSAGNPVQPSAGFAGLLGKDFDTSQAYLAELSEALDELPNGKGRDKQDLSDHIVVASVFTTQSATAMLEKVRRQVGATTPAPADFLLGPGGTRTVFPLSDITGVMFKAQTKTCTAPSCFATLPFFSLDALNVIPGVVRELAFGKYSSPDYEVHPGEYIPPIGTLTGTPVASATNDIYFNLFLPSGPKPESGWPVAIFGHGATGNKNAAFLVAAKMAQHGIATIAINMVGHGFGPLGTLTVTKTDLTSVSFSAGGRGRDQDADGSIDSNEGFLATPPRAIIANTDGIRQTVVDVMELVRLIQVGMDVHGSGTSDLDSSRIYYFGISLGGIYGTIFLAVEPDVLVGVPNVAGGPRIDLQRLSPVTRAGVGASLAASVPSLINIGGTDFNENLPLRDEPPLINTVPGADAIQQRFDRSEWVTQPGNSVAYAPYIRKEPLEGVPAKSTIFQFAKGDEQVPNPTTTAMLRAGDLADVATYYRNDLAFAVDSNVPKTPHIFLIRVPPVSSDPLVNAIALDAQEQIATLFESNGDTVINPDPAFFEVPIVPPLPETCNYLFPLPPPSPPFPFYLFFPSC